MVQPGQITLYTHVYSPYCHRVRIALEEAKAKYTSYELDFMGGMPDWYVTKVNPAARIPAITYGGPNTAPEEPAAEAAKINESLVILEFLADLFPEAKLLPADPVSRAEVRLAINNWETKGFEGFRDFVFRYAQSENAEKTLLDGLGAFQAILPSTGFVVGEWSSADSAVAPFLLCLELLLKNDLGKYPVGEGVKVYQTLQGPQFARLKKYLEDIKGYPSVKATWDEALQTRIWHEHPVVKRA